MFVFPQLDPIAFSLGPIQVHWYGLMYTAGFLASWGLGNYRASKPGSGWTTKEVGDMLTWIMLGVILGARIGYTLFYNFSYYIENPIEIFYLWQGGMSFHGGLLGGMLSLYLWGRTTNKRFLDMLDFTAPFIAPGLFLGRMANFVNGELWGRVTTSPLGMVFPHVDAYPRHPVQLYEAFLEGLLLFVIIWIFSSKERPQGAVAGLFAFCYGLFRMFCEHFREPDVQVGYLFGEWFTMGMLLSLPLVLVGVVMLGRAMMLKANPTREKIILDDGEVVYIKKK